MKKVLKIKVLSLLFVGFLTLKSNKILAQEKEYTIENCVNTFNKEEVKPTKVGYQYWFADKDFLDGRTLKMSVVAPGKATHPPHKHKEDEFFYVLEGKAKFHLNGKEVVVEANTSLYCPSFSMHGISNAGDTDLKYLVIKKYEKK
ncbi:cupin domain-containing protein [Polaribacter haliotis]|uniref:Cupin domain-containing protein n=1 Tax=Polaribacter haliotis TaxID=1888915 RepID=A0A7L8ADY9_9FLAO|nr:cupin domain-containing protein [Polaribacter haliotis]QOD60211.1 cupin domain-containing protein [Polaribacter haliotis]